jgi:hypothetical protein
MNGTAGFALCCSRLREDYIKKRPILARWLAEKSDKKKALLRPVLNRCGMPTNSGSSPTEPGLRKADKLTHQR